MPFTPPSLDSYEGPATGFVPPPLESHEGAATKPSAAALAGAFLQGINPLTGTWQTLSHPIDTAKAAWNQAAGLRDQAGKDFKAGNYADALQHGLGGIIPGIGPMASNALDTITDPNAADTDVARQMGQIAMPLASKAVGPTLGLLGKGAQAAGIPLAESAAGIRAMDRANGKTPGKWLLESTKGIKPSTALDSTRARIGLLSDAYEAQAKASPIKGSLYPALDVLDKRAAEAAAGNSASTPAEIAKMQAHLTAPNPGFAGEVDPVSGSISPEQSAASLLRMKREFGKDYTNWRANPSPEMQTAQQAYGALDGELDKAIPGGAATNQEISSLIAAKRGLKQKDLNAGVVQNIAHRVAAPTGALASTIAGGLAAGPVGAAAGLVLPEVLSSTAARLAAARGLYGAGKGMMNTTAQRAAQAALLSGGLLGADAQKPKGLLY